MAVVSNFRRAFGCTAGLVIALASTAPVGGALAQETSTPAGNASGPIAIQVTDPFRTSGSGEASGARAAGTSVNLSGSLNQILTRGYKSLADENYGAARLLFMRATELAPDRSDLWLQLGYIELNLDNKEAAIAALEKAYKLDPTNNLIPHQIGFTQQQLGQNRAATESFYRATSGRDAERAREACGNVSVARPLSDRFLSSPYFIDVYAVPEYQSHYDVGVFQGDAKIGRSFEGDFPFDVYGGARITQDTKSQFTNFGPQNIYDNYALIYGGARVRPYKPLPVWLFADAGWAYDTVEQGRSRGRGDFRAGAVGNYEWNMGLDCDAEDPFHRRWIADFYGDAIYYTRYSNMIAFGRFRPGYRFYDSLNKAAEVYLLTQASWDTEDVIGNRYLDLGVGSAFRLYSQIPLTFRAEVVQREIIGSTDYTDFRFRIEYGARF